MKYVKDADDRKIEVNDLTHNRTLQHLRDINFYKFSIGDVLVREDKYGEAWKVKMASCGLAYKYVYAFENDLGVGYIRRLSVNGKKFVDTAVCIVYFDPAKTRFQLDSAYADHILLAAEGEELDVKSEYSDIKKKREGVHRKNKKAAIRITSEAEGVAFIQSLKPGDQFWYGSYSVRSINKEPFKVVSTKVLLHPSIGDSYIEYVQGGTGYYANRPQRLAARHLGHSYIFMTKPIFVDEIL